MFHRIKADLNEKQQEKHRRWLSVKEKLLSTTDIKYEKWGPNEDGSWNLKRPNDGDLDVDTGIDEFLSSMKKPRLEDSASG